MDTKRDDSMGAAHSESGAGDCVAVPDRRAAGGTTEIYAPVVPITPIVWARPSIDMAFCAIRTIAGGSVRTHCAGRWSETDTIETTSTPSSRCGGCLSSLGVLDLELGGSQ